MPIFPLIWILDKFYINTSSNLVLTICNGFFISRKVSKYHLLISLYRRVPQGAAHAYPFRFPPLLSTNQCLISTSLFSKSALLALMIPSSYISCTFLSSHVFVNNATVVKDNSHISTTSRVINMPCPESRVVDCGKQDRNIIRWKRRTK